MKTVRALSLISTVAWLAGCTQNIHETSPFRPTATVQEIMLSIIDPNIDYVWNSVSTVSTAGGTQERRPETDEEWNTIKQHALTVLEASNLLLIAGRPVAAKGASTSSGGAELPAEQIQKLIDANRAAYIERAHGLHDAVQRVLAAIDRKDVDALVETGGEVEQACEQCHSQFWYPNDKRPGS